MIRSNQFSPMIPAQLREVLVTYANAPLDQRDETALMATLAAYDQQVAATALYEMMVLVFGEMVTAMAIELCNMQATHIKPIV